MGYPSGVAAEGGTPMDATTLTAYRQALYATFTRASDALFEVCDAVLTAVGARSFVELSHAPGFQRRWPSVYAAVQDGQIDQAAVRRLFAEHAPPQHQALAWCWGSTPVRSIGRRRTPP